MCAVALDLTQYRAYTFGMDEIDWELVETNELLTLPGWHGTRAPFKRFSAEHYGSASNTADEPAFFFTSSRSVASDYAENMQNAPQAGVMGVDVDFRDIFVVEGHGREYQDIPIPKLIEYAMNNRHDGMLIRDVQDGVSRRELSHLILAFRPEMIKIREFCPLRTVELS